MVILDATITKKINGSKGGFWQLEGFNSQFMCGFFTVPPDI